MLGAEIDLNLLVADGLTFTLSYGYLDTQLGESALTTDLGLSEILSDNLPYAPDHSVYTAFDYRRPLGPGTLGLHLNYGWQDDVGTSVTDNGNFVVDSYGLLGAAASWSELTRGEHPRARFQMPALGTQPARRGVRTLRADRAPAPRCADETQIYGEPRTYGVTVTYSF